MKKIIIKRYLPSSNVQNFNNVYWSTDNAEIGKLTKYYCFNFI